MIRAKLERLPVLRLLKVLKLAENEDKIKINDLRVERRCTLGTKKAFC